MCLWQCFSRFAANFFYHLLRAEKIAKIISHVWEYPKYQEIPETSGLPGLLGITQDIGYYPIFQVTCCPIFSKWNQVRPGSRSGSGTRWALQVRDVIVLMSLVSQSSSCRDGGWEWLTWWLRILMLLASSSCRDGGWEWQLPQPAAPRARDQREVVSNTNPTWSLIIFIIILSITIISGHYHYFHEAKTTRRAASPSRIVGLGYSQCGTFWGVLNVSLCIQLGLESAHLSLWPSQYHPDHRNITVEKVMFFLTDRQTLHQNI